MNKKILIITYYWPPAGGPGVQRWLKFTKYLPEFGYEPHVYIPENPSYPILDQSLVKEINPKVKIIKKPIWEPYQLAEKITKKNKDFKAGQFETSKKLGLLSRLSVFIRGNFFIPDARKFWIKPSIAFLTDYIKEHKIDILITTGPPHSMHLIGLGLKQICKENLKWIADFRDPWTKISYYSQLKLTRKSDKKHKELEKKVMQTADVVISTSYTDKENFEKLGAKNVVCITNGFDSEVNILNKKTLKFTLSYVGMLETLRNPVNLWNVLSELISQNPEFASHFCLKFVGKISNSILDELNHSIIKDKMVNIGYLSHTESINEMNNSDLLLITNFNNEQSKGIIPGKLFEYLATGKGILSLGPKNADVEKILNETESGKHFTYYDHENLMSFLMNEFEKWKNNLIASPNLKNSKFHRKMLTEDLSNTIFSIFQKKIQN